MGPVGPTIGFNAIPTVDPRIFTLARALGADGMQVGIAQNAAPTEVSWLKVGDDYTYDQTAATITLRSGLSIDGEKEYLFVSGSLSNERAFAFHQPLEEGSVRVVLGGARLEEGAGFSVDYEGGVVTILDAGIQEGGASYYIEAGTSPNTSIALGNYHDMERLKRLLAD